MVIPIDGSKVWHTPEYAAMLEILINLRHPDYNIKIKQSAGAFGAGFAAAREAARHQIS